MTKNLNVEFVWQEVSEELQKEVVNFWLKEGAITKEVDANNRAKELLAVCRNKEGIVGVSTGIRSMYPPLKNYFLIYRSYVTTDYRHQGVARQLYHLVFDRLNKAEAFKNHKIIGMMAAFENAHLNQNKKAVWAEDRNLTFIGFDPRGVQLRVSYFDNAEIELPGIKT